MIACFKQYQIRMLSILNKARSLLYKKFFILVNTSAYLFSDICLLSSVGDILMQEGGRSAMVDLM